MSTTIVETNTTNPPSLTFQEYQDIYSEITQKSENIHKKYAKTFTLKKQNINHLKSLMDDVLRQYQVVSKSTNVTVFQTDNVQKTYSSIENFLTIDTTAKGTAGVIVEYDVLIQVPNIEKKQNYKFVINVVSDLIAFEKMRDELPTEILGMIQKDNINVKIDYIDYTIAKSILNIIDEWVKDISEIDNKLISMIDKKKNFFAGLIKNALIVFSFILLYTFVPNYISNQNIDMQIVVKFFILSFMIIYFTKRASLFISNITKSSLTSLRNYSAIQLTEQDAKNIVEHKKKRFKRISSFVFTIILTILYGVASSVIASKYFSTI